MRKYALATGMMLVIGLGMKIALAAAPVRQALLSWGAVTTDVEGNQISGVTYNVYRGAKGSAVGAKTKIASGITALSYTDSGRPAGTEDCYQVTAQTPINTEGVPSTEGCKSYPAVAAGAVQSLVVQ